MRELERQTQEVHEQLTQVRADSGEEAKRMAALEQANDGAAERLARLEKSAREEAQRLGERLDEALEQLARVETEAAAASELRVAPTESPDLSGALEQVDQLRTQAGEVRVAFAAMRSEREQARTRLEELASVRGQLDELQAGRDEMRAEASRSAEEAAQARQELADVRRELAANSAEVAQTKAELAEARELAAAVREVAESARADAESAAGAGDQARGAAESGEQALRLAEEAREQAGAAAERSEVAMSLLEEVGGEVARTRAESEAAREELASLHAQAEDILRVVERSVARVLTGGPPADDGWVEDPAPPTGAPVAAAPAPAAEPAPASAMARDLREGFDDVSAPMAMLNLEGRFLELNPAFTDLVGYSEQEFTSAIWPSSLSDETTRKEHRELRGRLATGEIEESPIETCYLHKEGLMVPVSGTVCMVRGPDGSPHHLLLSGAGDRAALSA